MVGARDLRVLRMVPVLMALWIVTSASEAKYGGGAGEPNNPYLIYMAEQLNAIGAEPNDWDKRFKLMADIDLSGDVGKGFRRIGNSQKRFTGGFDGNGHLVRNLVIAGQGPEPVGFFGHVTFGARIERLGIVDAKISGTETVGILAGENAGSITACYTTGSVTCVPEPQKTPEQIKAEKEEEEEARKLEVLMMKEMGDLFPPQAVSAPEPPPVRVGGLVGINYRRIEACYSEAEVHIQVTDSNNIEAGGLVGANMGFLAASYSIGPVAEPGGGLLGRNEIDEGARKGYVHVCYWDIEKSGVRKSAAGFGNRTSELKQIDMFRGWDYGQHWTIADGQDYPRLQWERRAGKPMPGYESFLDGTGRSDDPFVIRTAEQLMLFGRFRSAWDKCLELADDIDFKGIDPNDFIPVGVLWQPFTGVFDGGGHSISNFTHKSDADNGAGFFRMVGKRVLGLVLENGVVKNVTLKKAFVSGQSEVGLLVGRNHGVVENCRAEGTVVGAGSYIGGLVGFSFGHISACSSMGNVRGRDRVGGLVGSAKHSRSYDLEDCHSACRVSGRKRVGGLAGEIAGNVIGCSATGDVTGQEYVGGLLGDGGDRTHACFATGNVTGEANVGGLMGSGGRGASACYATGSVSGKRLVGGLIGYNHGGVVACYAAGKITGDEYVGGLVGTSKMGDMQLGIVSLSYWDSQTSGIRKGEGGIGKPTKQLMQAKTFAGWDIDGTWVLNEGREYPRLAWEAREGKPIRSNPARYAGGTDRQTWRSFPGLHD